MKFLAHQKVLPTGNLPGRCRSSLFVVVWKMTKQTFAIRRTNAPAGSSRKTTKYVFLALEPLISSRAVRLFREAKKIEVVPQQSKKLGSLSVDQLTAI